MSYHKVFMLAVLLCLLSSNLQSQSSQTSLDQEGNISGTNWREFTEIDETIGDVVKQAYLKGLYEGLQVGTVFASEEGLKKEYYQDTTREHLVRALDQFYQDYRNEQVPAVFALRVISMELKGEPKEEIDAELRRMRQVMSDVLQRDQ